MEQATSYNQNNPLRVFTAFSGYDSQCLALDRLCAATPGLVYKLVGWSEIDANAIAAHNILYPDEAGLNYGDISQIDWAKVPDFDLFTWSFPCTDISSAGLQKGLGDGSGTRSSLAWECIKAATIKRPKYMLMENVKALVSDKFMPDFRRLAAMLEELGYVNHYRVLNAKDYGVPQNRERVFMVSILSGGAYYFPKPFKLDRRLKDVLEDEVDESYYLSGDKVKAIVEHCERKVAEGCGFKTNFVDPDTGISGAIKTKEGSREYDTYLRERLGVDPDTPMETYESPFDGMEEPKIVGYSRDEKGHVVSRHLKDEANTITTCSGSGNGMDQFVAMPQQPSILTPQRTEQGRELRRQGVDVFAHKELVPRDDGVANTLTSVQKDNYLLEPQQPQPVVVQKVGDRGTSNYSVKDIANTIPANPMSDRGQMLVEPAGCYDNSTPDFMRDPTPGLARTVKADHHNAVLENGKQPDGQQCAQR